jgi:hypothetical protein
LRCVLINEAFKWLTTTALCHDFGQSIGKIAYRRQSGARVQVLPPRHFPHVLTALFLIAGASLVSLLSTVDSRAEGASAICADAPELAVLPAPIAPWTGAPLRVLVVAEKPLEGELSLIAPDGTVAAKSPNRHGGPPYFWYAEIGKRQNLWGYGG